MKRNSILCILLCILLLTSSCSRNQSVETDTLVPPTATESSLPTDTYTPPATIKPTATLLPPTNTPLPPTASTVDLLTDQLAGDFDFFILALAWEPNYCATSENPDPQSCTPGMKLGFILHGLWPTYYVGYPSYCTNETISNEWITEFPGLFPTDFLYHHEWEKHGTCTGLDPAGYFQLSQELKRTITIPEAFISPEEPFRMDEKGLVELFVNANPAYDEESFSVFCTDGGQYLSEIYVCFGRDGQPTKCGAETVEINDESCGQPDFLVRKPQ